MFPSFVGLDDADDNDDDKQGYSSKDIASRRSIRVQIAGTTRRTHVISVFARGTR